MTKKLILLHILFVFGLSLTFQSCNDSEHTQDVSGIEVNVPLYRFEQKLFPCKSAEDVMAIKELNPTFYDIYSNSIVTNITGSVNQSEEQKAIELYRYVNDPDIDSLYKLTQGKFGDFTDYHEQFIELAKYIKFHFPEEDITGVNTFVSAFNYASIFDNDNKSFGVGLDFYMGRDFEIYGILDPQFFPKYRIRRFEEYYILPNAAQSFLNYKVKKFDTNKWIDQAVYEGIVLYGMDVLLPETHDTLKMAYTREHLAYNKEFESDMWGYILENDILFSTDKNKHFQPFFNDGPFTTTFGNESSPKIGSWIGWQIVRSYMKKNPDLKYADLIQIEDYTQLFKESGYRP